MSDEAPSARWAVAASDSEMFYSSQLILAQMNPQGSW
jgi:hypothetical protein